MLWCIVVQCIKKIRTCVREKQVCMHNLRIIIVIIIMTIMIMIIIARV
jgi:hypothetical protein